MAGSKWHVVCSSLSEATAGLAGRVYVRDRVAWKIGSGVAVGTVKNIVTEMAGCDIFCIVEQHSFLRDQIWQTNGLITSVPLSSVTPFTSLQLDADTFHVTFPWGSR